MLSFIQEHVSCWDRLRSAAQPIVLYGMGNGADKILDWCEANNVHVSAVFASDEFVRGQQFRGFTVQKYADVVAQFGSDILIVIAFASELPEVLARFEELNARHDVLAPHLPLFDETELVSNRWLAKYEAQLQEVHDRLADDASREVFAAVLNYKLSGKISYLFSCATDRRSDLTSIFSWNDSESYLDLGAYNGDTMQEFIELTHGKWQRIIAVEPDRRNFKKLAAMTEALPQEAQGRITLHQAGVWSAPGQLGFSDSGGRQSSFLLGDKKTVPVDCIDNFAAGNTISYIKMDVEGVELEAIAGGRQVISRYKPKLFIAAYHYDVDIFRIPLTIWQLAPDYKIYLRKHPYVPAWEINFLAII